MRKLADPEWHRKFNRSMMLVWIALGVPTVLLWRESIFWLAFMSWYTIVIDHMTAWLAARSNNQ